MLNKLGLVLLGFVAGLVIGGVGAMACFGFTISRGMFTLQDMDILRAEDTAT
ncbi:MAG: hypothetical protein J7K65_05525 [Planctomycetes bacterium]|nr:hypothetical protein [Planctomycetota bacterium]